MFPNRGISYREVLSTKNHEIHFWRIIPGEWIYPHTHPHSDDIWYIIQGTGDYYITSKDTNSINPGDMTVATPGDVHGVFNSGSEDIIIYSILSPLPVEVEEAPGFNYPE